MSTNSPPFTSSDPVIVSSSSPVVVLSSAKSTDNNGLPLITGSNDVRSAFGCQNATGVLSDQGNITRLLSSDSSVIPEVPAIPSELMIPPRVARHSISPFVGEKAAVGDLSVGAGSSRVDVGKLQDNIDSMRTHLGRQVGTLTEIQNQLTVRAHELERVRAELKEHGEMEQRAALMKHPLPSGRPTGPPYIDSVTSGSTAGILSGLATKTFATATPNVGITGTEHEIRELRAQTEDLRSRLILTTNLCTKQETYYRDIIVELENRLKETIAGRDHVLALREAESGNQLQLMQQLESALTKQQGMNSHKEEVLHSYETKLLVLEDNVKNTELIVDKFVQLVHEEEKKRGRTGFMSDSRVSGTPSARIVGQSAAQALQRCLLEDEGDKQLLRAKLTRVEGELAELKQLAESRHSEQQKSHEKHVSKLEDNRKQAIESASLKQEETKKELCHLQEELAKLRKEQTAELATRDRRVTSLELELETVKRQKSEAVHALENKCRTIEETEREVRTELELLQGEKARLMTAVSQEQAKNINLNEKLSQTEQHLDKEKQGHNKLDEEYRTLQDSSAEEIKRLQAELKKQDEILKETNEKLMAEQVAEVEAVKQEEREKSNTRLDGILQELNKMNEHVSQLRTDLDLKNNEVQSLNLDTLKQKEQLDLQEKEICVMRQNVIDFVQKLEEKESELRRAKEEIAQFTQTNEEMAENLKTTENSNEKLQTQLEEREKTIQTFKQQGASLAEILEKNNKNGDSLQREREQLVQKLQETISQVEEMKKHREILARKLKAKDKRTKELEEENEVVGKQLKAKKEELAAMMNDREGIMAEVKMRQREVTELRDERNTLSALLEGRDGEKEKEINQLLSRLKGSEQDLNLTRKLLKTKRDISGKAVRVAESMQKEVTCKRGEVDTLQSKYVHCGGGGGIE